MASLPHIHGQASNLDAWQALLRAPTVVGGLVLVLTLAFYLPVPFVDSVYNGHRLIVTLALVILLLRVRTPPGWLAASGVVALVLLGLASLPDAPMPAELWAVVISHLALVLAGWRACVFAREDDPAARRTWMVAAVLCALVYGVRVGAALVAGIQSEPVLLREVFLGFANVRHFAQLTPLLLPVIACAAVTCAASHRRRLGYTATAALVVWWMLIWLNGSSGAMYAIWIGLAVATLIAGWRRARSLVWAITGAFFGALAIIYGLNLVTPLFSGVLASVEPGLSGRGILWQQAFDLLMTQPWLAYGPGQYAYLIATGPGHPHNLLLSLGLDYGLIGLAILGLLFWRWFSPLRLGREARAIPVTKALWPTALVAAAFAGLAHAMVSGVVVMPLAQLTLALTLGLLAGSVRPPRPPLATGNVPIRVAGAGVAGLLVIAVAVSLPQTCGYFEPGARCRASPAFWGQYPLTLGASDRAGAGS